MFLTCRSGTDKLQLTHEQVRIIKHDVKDGELIKIVAFAGIVLNNLEGIPTVYNILMLHVDTLGDYAIRYNCS